MYKSPLRTSSAPSPIRTILASSIHRCHAQLVRIQASGGVVRSGHQRVFSPRGSNNSCDCKAVSGAFLPSATSGKFWRSLAKSDNPAKSIGLPVFYSEIAHCFAGIISVFGKPSNDRFVPRKGRRRQGCSGPKSAPAGDMPTFTRGGIQRVVSATGFQNSCARPGYSFRARLFF